MADLSSASNAITTGNSVFSSILSALGYDGWSLQDGVYNGCTFTSFVKIPIIQDNPVVQNGLNLIAAIEEISGYSPFSTDPNGLGRLYSTFLGTLQFSDEMHIQTVVKELPFTNRCNTEQMGLGGYTFRMTLLFIGPDYQKALRNFENAILNPPPLYENVLTHPTRGIINGVTRIVEPPKIDTSFSNYNAAVVNVVFRSELSDGGNQSTSQVQDYANAIQAALAAIAGIFDTLAQLGAYVDSANRLTTGQTTNQTNSQYQVLTTQTTQTTQVLLNSVNYIYKTNNSSVTNSTLDPLPINYSAIPRSLNSVSRYAPSQADIIMNNYINQCQGLLTNIAASNLSAQSNNLVNSINQSITALSNVCQNAASYVPTINYVTDNLMSIRTVVARNGIPFSAIPQIMALNPNLLSANYIPAGTSVML